MQRSAPILLATMRRSSWLLCLLIAMLPLRGMAQLVMQPSSPAPSTASAAVATDQAPCPLHVASPDAGSATPSMCSLCDVCHSVAMPMPHVVASGVLMAAGSPQPAQGLGAGHAPADGLFRPPR